MGRIISSQKELDNILNRLHVSFFGAGYASRILLKYVFSNGFYVDKIYVSNVNENPSRIFNVVVHSVDELVESEGKMTSLIIALTEKNQDETVDKLKDKGFKEIFCVTDELLRQVERLNNDKLGGSEHLQYSKAKCEMNEEDRLLKFVQKPCLEYMIVNILDHCNLRCKGCDHFACIADEKFYKRDNIYRDLSRMAEIFHGDYIMKIAVMGGEPLLHPELKQILKDVRSLFPYTTIRLTTNGLLLLQQDEEFWKVCRDNDVTIVNTKYPINLKYDEMQRKADQEKVKFQFFEGTGDGLVKHSFKKIVNLKGDSNPVESFSKCHISNYGNFLLEGKFYGCPFSAQSYRVFNKRYNQNLRITNEDYIDIYKVHNKEAFFEFAARPKFYCRYCEGLSPEFPWERSKQDIAEWI